MKLYKVLVQFKGQKNVTSYDLLERPRFDFNAKDYWVHIEEQQSILLVVDQVQGIRMMEYDDGN